MELPDELLAIVREFSRPLTRPDWRNLRPMTSRQFHQDILDTYYRVHLPVIETFVLYRYDQIQYTYVQRSTFQPIYKLLLNEYW